MIPICEQGDIKYMEQCKQNKGDKGGFDGCGLPPGLQGRDESLPHGG